jgi:A/G-specific adenine glycosylase
VSYGYTNHIPVNDISFFQSILLDWYTVYARFFPWRQPGLTEYELIIAEALLQRTRADIVAKHYDNFLLAYPDWHSLSCADTLALTTTIRPLGLAAQRAPMLQALAQEMVRREGVLPLTRQELQTIPFYGHYLINAIELIIFHRPVPLLDVNMARLLERFFGPRKLTDIRRDPYLQELAYRVANHLSSKNLSWAILDFATLVCRASRPRCQVCPLSQKCQYFELELAHLT